MEKNGLTKREFLKKVCGAGCGVATGALFADEAPIGDPTYRGFCEKIADIPHSMEDGASAFLRNGKVFQPAREVPVFSKADVVVVGGGPAGFAGALSGKRFTDCVAVSGCDMFVNPEFQIPFRSLLPKGVENVVACGRCIGCSPDLIDRVRLIGPCFVTGQAAGVAAAIAARREIPVRQAPVEEIRKTLIGQGAYLG